MGWGYNMMNGRGYGGFGCFGGYGNGGYWWMGIIGLAVQLLIVVGIIWLISMFFRRKSSSNSGILGRQNSGLDILRERYARGEIDSEEFQIRKQDLESK